MADKYLVPCACGKSVSVTAHQAGSQIPCECGATVHVPPLRKLRTMPRDEQVVTEAPSTWTPRHAIALGGTVLTLILLAVAGWMTATQPETPEFGKFYQQRLSDQVGHILEGGKPIDFWIDWESRLSHLGDHGFDEISTPQQEDYVAKLDERVLHRNIVLAAAGVVAVLTIVGCLAWPKPVTKS